VKLIQTNGVKGTHALYCNCPDLRPEVNKTFRIEFRRSASAQKNSELARAYNGPGSPPDVLVVICSHCGNEIQIMNTQENFAKSVHDIQDAFENLNDSFPTFPRGWEDNFIGQKAKFKVHPDVIREQQVDDEIEELRRKLGRGE
jgi:hypothetical protein